MSRPALFRWAAFERPFLVVPCRTCRQAGGTSIHKPDGRHEPVTVCLLLAVISDAFLDGPCTSRARLSYRWMRCGRIAGGAAVQSFPGSAPVDHHVGSRARRDDETSSRAGRVGRGDKGDPGCAARASQAGEPAKDPGRCNQGAGQVSQALRCTAAAESGRGWRSRAQPAERAASPDRRRVDAYGWPAVDIWGGDWADAASWHRSSTQRYADKSRQCLRKGVP